MIEERHCSREVSKLLCEKGFVQGTDLRMTRHLAFYDNEGLRYDIDRWYDSMVTENVPFVVAPTHQMACDWLREVHHICITIYPDKEKGFEVVLYDTESDVEITIQSFGVFGYHIFESSYGEAVEAAIKYSLENLV